MQGCHARRVRDVVTLLLEWDPTALVWLWGTRAVVTVLGPVLSVSVCRP